MSDDLDRLADFLDRDDPQVARILWAAHHTSGMRGAACDALRRLCKTGAGVNPDNLPAFGLVRELPPGEIVLGHVLNGDARGPVFALPSSILTQHVGVFSASGAGKSVLVRHLAAQCIAAGDKVWAFDLEDEHASLLSLFPPEQLIAVTPSMLRLSLFQPPHESISPKQWLGALETIFRWAMFLRDGSLNLFDASMLKLFERKGVLTGSGAYPTLGEALQLFTGMRFAGSSRTGAFLESLLNRLSLISNTMGESFEASTSEHLAFLANRSVIYRLHELPLLIAQWFVGYVLAWLAAYKDGERT